MAEQVRQIADRHRRAERARAAVAAVQIADQRFAADEKLVGHHVPGTDQDPAGLNGRAQPRLLLGTDLEVVLEHDRLSIEMEVFVLRVGVEQIQKAIDERHEAQPELLVGQIPLAIPMRMRDDVDVEHSSRFTL